MDEENKKKIELTEGSKYRITSIGSRDNLIETVGIFRGFVSIGIDETGLLIELDKRHGPLAGKLRIIPLNVILLIDILAIKENEKKNETKGVSHYVR